MSEGSPRRDPRQGGAVRLYALLLRLMPRPVRERDGEEMVRTFAAVWAEARGARRRVRCLASCFGRLPIVAFVEWWDHLGAARRARYGRGGGGGEMEAMGRVVRIGTRTLLRAPAFTWTTVLLLGLGVGSTTTIFTLVDHLFLRPLPYPGAERLVRVNGSQSHPAVRDLEDVRSVEAWAAAAIDHAHLTGEGDPVRIGQARVTPGFFTFFGANPSLGRLLSPEDFASADGVVLSHGAWERIFGGSGEVVGRAVTIDGAPVVVAGVLSRSFAAPEALLDGAVADVWRPVDRSAPDFEDRGPRTLVVAGRLAPGATLDEAGRELAALAERRAREFPGVYVRGDGTIVELPVVTLHEATVGRAREAVRLLLGAVTLLLLVACANLAHLFMARAVGRSRDVAVRRALGADTRLVAAQLVSESLLIAAGGTLAGIVLAAAGLQAFLHLAPETLPRAGALTLDGRVVAFTAALSTVTALVFGLLPTLWVAGRQPGGGLRAGGRGATHGRGARTLRGGLVMTEVALSVVLVASAGLLLRSFARLQEQPLGFRVEGVWTIPVRLTGEETMAGWQGRLDRVGEALRLAPGVRSVTHGLSVPLEHIGGTCCWSRTVRRADADEGVNATIHPFDGDYFDVFGPHVLTGRGWRPTETSTTRAPVLLNEPLAVRLFGSVEAAMGREVSLGEAGHHVVGVVAEDRHYGLFRRHGPAGYVPMSSVPFVADRATFAVRVESADPDVPRLLREAVWSVEPEVPLPVVRSMEEWATRATARTRFDGLLFGTFGLVALLLAAGGLYGTLLYTVTTERRELAIRLALGAKPWNVQAGVLGRGLLAAGAGAIAGGAGAWASGRLLQNRLFEVQAGDPLTVAVATAVLLLTAAAASWLPARRAAATDPLETLRQE